MLDNRTASWILEFVLLQPIDDWIANAILAALPFSAPLAPRLNKALLLRRLAADLSRSRPSERTLHSFELIEEIDRAGGSPEPSAPMRSAYCAVAVECTVKPLRDCCADADAVEFLDAVNRIWNCRVADLERSEAAGLVSMLLREARREFEAAVVDPVVRVGLMGRDTEKEALDSIEAYLKYAAQEMGPSFLELAAEAVIAKQRSLEADPSIDNGLLGLANRRHHESHKVGSFTNQFDQMPTPDALKVEEGLISSCLRPLTVVEDCLPGIRTREAGVSSYRVGEAPMNPEKVNKDRHRIYVESLSVDKGIEVLHVEDTGTDSGHNRDPDAVLHPSLAEQNPSDTKVVEENPKGVSVNTQDCTAVPHPSILEWCPTALTYEFNHNSIQYPFEKSPNPSKKLHSEKKVHLKRNEKKRKWSSLEEETLRKAVEVHGKGNWKFIKKCHPTIFKDRTEVNLKDKWRNMIRQ